MDDRPELIVHPGFAKCATTSIQQAFQAQDYFLCRLMSVDWMGAAFRPFNRGAPVFDVAKGPDHVRTLLAGANIDAGRGYFLSAENLVNQSRVLDALAERFRLVRAVLTIRVPILLSLSEFYFRDWLTTEIDDAIVRGFQRLPKQLGNKLRSFRTMFSDRVELCPVEQEDLLDDFCRTAFGIRVSQEKSRQVAMGAQNRSAHPCFLMAVQAQYRQMGSPALDGMERRHLIQSVQRYELNIDCAPYLPVVVLEAMNDESLISEHVEDYIHLLAKNSKSFGPSRSEQVRRLVLSRISDMRIKSPIPDFIDERLQGEAAELLRKIVSP